MFVRLLIKTVTLSLTGVLAALFGLFVYLFFATKLPDTEELRNFYLSRQAEFEKANREVVFRLVAKQPVAPAENKELGYFRVEAALKPAIAVNYYTHQRGIGLGAFGTGVAYLEVPPDRIYTSLEAMKQDSRAIEGFTGYGHLSGNWYYFYWELD